MKDSLQKIIEQKKSQSQFQATMGLFSATILGMGAIMGAGIYVLVGLAASRAGSAVWLAYLLCAGLAYLSVLLYAEMSRMVTTSGGGYAYCYRILGPWWGFISGWHLAIGSIFGCAIYALGFAIYGSDIIPGVEPSPWLYKLIAISLTLLFTFMNTRGGKEGSLQQILTIGNVIVLLIISCLAFRYSQTKNIEPILGNGVSSIVGTFSIIYLSFFGYQLIANNSEEIIDAKRTVPLAIHLSLIISTIIYMCIVLAVTLAVPWQELAKSPAPLSYAAEKAAGQFGWWLVICGGLMASGAALNSTLVSQSRQIYAMGRDRLMPRSLGKLDSEKGIPKTSILLGGIVVSLVILLLDMETIVVIANFCFLVSMLPVSFALMRLQKQKIQEGMKISRFRLVIPWLALIANASLLIMMGWETLVWGNQVILIGLIVFAFYSKGNENRGQMGLSVSLEENTNSKLGNKRILVPLGNPQTQNSLLVLAESILTHQKKKDGEIVALSIVQAAKEVDFLTAIEKSPEEMLELLEKSKKYINEERVKMHSVVRASRSLPLGVVHGARDEKCHLVVMGYSRRQDTRGSILDSVLSNATSDIVFLNAKSEFAPKRVTVALGGKTDNLNLMMRIAASLVDRFDGEITFLSVVPKDPKKRQKEVTDRILIKAIQKNNSRALYRAHMIKSDDALKTLIEHSKETDIIIVGTTKVGITEKPVFGDFAIKLADAAHCSVAIVYTMTTQKKWIQ